MERIWEWGITIVLALQSAGAGLTPLWRSLSILGTDIFFLVLISLLFWCVSPRMSVRVGLVLLIGTALNAWLKLVFAGPRPFWYSTEVKALTSETTFGVPSAHAQNTVSLWGVIAAGIARPWAWGGMLLLALLVGIARVALGVHFPTDVLAGWLLGGLVLFAFLTWAEPLWHRVAALSLGRQLGLSFLISLLLIALPALALAMHSDHALSPAWLESAARALPDEPIDPWSLENAYTVGGMWFGFTAGALLLWARGGFDASGPWWQRGLRLGLGIVVVLALWGGLGALFPRDETVLAALLRYLRYALIGLWIALGAPLVFQQLGLAKGPAPVKTATQPS